jgi:phosphoadenosine phosphosulfate reductase
MIDLEELNEELESRSTEEIVAWSVETFAPEIGMSCSFQTQSLPLLHLVHRIAPQLLIIFLDTGYHFPETLAFRDRLVRDWGLNLRVVRAHSSPGAQSQPFGGDLYRVDPDLCCYLNKVQPMKESLRGMRAWMSGIRRDQSNDRSTARVLEETADGIVRVHPMLRWTRDDVARYIQAHQLPEHPLQVRGYRSIGCAPCTQPVEGTEDDRSGRWPGADKTECGLHTNLRQSTEAGHLSKE